MKTLAAICDILGYSCPFDDCTVEHVTCFGNGLEKNSVLFTIKHETTDSHIFNHENAKDKIAAIFTEKQIGNFPCIISENPKGDFIRYAAACRKMHTIKSTAVTGSIGKTSTKDMIYSVLSAHQPTIRTINSNNGLFSAAKNVLSLQQEHKYLLTEMGLRRPNSSFKAISNVVLPDVCVITNIGSPHIENFRDKQHILKHKLYIAEGMSKDNGLLVINADDELLMSQSYPFPLTTFGIKNTQADYFGKNIVVENESINFDAICPNNSILKVHLNVTGKHNVLCALAAIVTAKHFGIPDHIILEGLANFKTEGIRQNVQKRYKNNTVIFDCFGAAPESNISAFELLKDIKKTDPRQKKIAVLGHMMRLGRFSEQLHRETGAKLAEYSFDLVVTYNGNSRYFTEEVKKRGGNAIHFDDKDAFIEFMRTYIQKDDIILFKGINKFCNFDILVNEILDEKTQSALQKKKNVYCGELSTAGIQTDASSCAVINCSNNILLFGKNIHTPRNVASLSMVLAGIVLIDKIDRDEIVTVSKTAVDYAKGCRKAGILAGEKYKAIDLLAAALIGSAFDCMAALTEYIAGDIKEFAEFMNAEALRMGAVNTHFNEPCGKSRLDNVSTAYDMALIFSNAMNKKELRSLISSSRIELTNHTDDKKIPICKQSKFLIENPVSELDLFMPDAVPVKDGNNVHSNFCRATAINVNGNYVCAIMLGCNDTDYNAISYFDTKRIFSKLKDDNL